MPVGPAFHADQRVRDAAYEQGVTLPPGGMGIVLAEPTLPKGYYWTRAEIWGMPLASEWTGIETWEGLLCALKAGWLPGRELKVAQRTEQL